MAVLGKTQAERNAEAKARRAKGIKDKDETEEWENSHTRRDDDFREYDDDFEKPKKHYESNEKEIWIYGRPGDENYKTDIDDNEYAELEIMW